MCNDINVIRVIYTLMQGLRKLNNVPEETESSEGKTEDKENNKMDADKDADKDVDDSVSNSARVDQGEPAAEKAVSMEEDDAGSDAAAASDANGSADIGMEESAAQLDTQPEEVATPEPAKEVVEEETAPAVERSTRKRKAT